MGKVNRGVHTLPAPEAVAEDPLGIATATHRVGEPLTVTVYPRIAFLRSCVLHPELGLRQDWAGSKGLPTPGASEFRGIRPHQPGEPLSHIDWKSTAKTGHPHAPRDGGAGRLRHHPAARRHRRPGGGQRRPTPTSSWRCAPRAASPTTPCGWAAASPSSATRSSRRQVRLTADGGGRRVLLETLAETRPDATAPLALVLRRLLAERTLATPLPVADPGGHDPGRADGPRAGEPPRGRREPQLRLRAGILVRRAERACCRSCRPAKRAGAAGDGGGAAGASGGAQPRRANSRWRSAPCCCSWPTPASAA